MENTEKKDTGYHSSVSSSPSWTAAAFPSSSYPPSGWPASAEAGIREWWHICRRSTTCRWRKWWSRSAECAGAGGIILPAKGGAAINADGVKASAGALLRIGVSKCKNLRIPLYYLKEKGFQIVAATEKAEGMIYGVDMTRPTAFVMGSEGKGISSSVLALCDVQARIPMCGDIGSLNVSVAASLMLFEAVRQRQK